MTYPIEDPEQSGDMKEDLRPGLCLAALRYGAHMVTRD